MNPVMIIEEGMSQEAIAEALAQLRERERVLPSDSVEVIVLSADSPAPTHCTFPGCRSIATVQPVLLLNTRRGTGLPLEMELPLVCCSTHASTDPNLYLDRSAWEGIKAHFERMKMIRPHWSRTTIRLDPLETP